MHLSGSGFSRELGDSKVSKSSSTRLEPTLSSTLSRATTLLGILSWLVLAGVSLAPNPAGAQEPKPSMIKKASQFAVSGGRATWSPRGDRIAFDRVEPNGYAQLFVARADLTEQRCLTCPIFEFKKRHVGNATWHSSGEFLVVQVEKPIRSGGSPLRFMEVPGGNLGTDLYMIRADGKDYFNLTNLGERGGRAYSPNFSREGDQLAWAERIASGGGAFGEWALRTARFEVKRGIPRLKNIQTYKPGAQRLFYDSHGFTTDDRGLVLTGNLERGQSESGMDVYLLDTESGETKRLTETLGELDRFALMAPKWALDRLVEQPRHRLWRGRHKAPAGERRATGGPLAHECRGAECSTPDRFQRRPLPRVLRSDHGRADLLESGRATSCWPLRSRSDRTSPGRSIYWSSTKPSGASVKALSIRAIRSRVQKDRPV